VGKVVAGEVACLVVLVFIVVVVVGLQDEEEPEKGWRQVFASQWSTVVPHQPYWEPEKDVSKNWGYVRYGECTYSTASQHTSRFHSEVRSFQQEPQTPAKG
jgi:hypothetical protein